MVIPFFDYVCLINRLIMKLKTILVAILSAVTAIILYKNREESSFWLFGDIITSKLILLCVFYILGIITGAIVFRRRNKHPKEYAITNPYIPTENIAEEPNLKPYATSNLSDEDRDFIRRD